MAVASAPTVSGVAKVGGVLTASGGAFSPAASSTSIAWLADGKPIPGAAGATLTLGPDQLDHRITAAVTGQRAGYTNGVATSAPTDPVGPENLALTQEPALGGAAGARVGQGLAVTPGVVGPADTGVYYHWLRDGERIPKANKASYVPTAEDLGHRLSVKVRYAKRGYNSIVRTLTVPDRVRAMARLRAMSTAHRKVTVLVRAAGLASVTVHGKVTLVNADGVKSTRILRNGRVTFGADWLRPGKRTFTVIYQGSAKVGARTLNKTLVVD
jgi:hypothetical protein